MVATRCRPSGWFDLLAFEPRALAGYVEMIRGQDLVAVQSATKALALGPSYSLVGDLAVVGLEGPLSKNNSSLASLIGGTSLLSFRDALRAAAKDERAKGIILATDSPGGQVAGVSDTAALVAEVAKVKPVLALIADACCSAGYWIASQAQHVLANDTAAVGSIGVFSSIVDESEKAGREGIRVRVIASGPRKGGGVSGAPVTDDDLAALQARVDAVAGVFLGAVQRGRRLSAAKVRELATGDVWIGAQAQERGLVDGIGGMREAVAWFARPRPTSVPAMAAIAAPRATVPFALHPSPKVEAKIGYPEVEALDRAAAPAVRAGYSASVARRRAMAAQPALRSAILSRIATIIRHEQKPGESRSSATERIAAEHPALWRVLTDVRAGDGA